MAVILEKARGPFVGRDRERIALKDALTRSKLVTVVGPGGVGKSRFVAEYFDNSPTELVQLRLDEIQDSADIPAHLVRALGLQPTGQADLQRARSELLNGPDRLVFFDNAEHVLEVLKDIINVLDVPTLVTSRLPLGVVNEEVVVVAELTEDEGLRLLCHRAELAGIVVPESAGRNLVRALDGLPLAIELAAARLVILDAEQLLKRLKESNQALGTKRAGRHTTLDQTMEWSWNALTEPEQQLMMVLAQFDHPLDPVLLEELWPQHDVVDLASSLESKSWLRVTQTQAGRRWSSLSVLRRFVQTRITPEVHQLMRHGLQRWAISHMSEPPGWWSGYIPEGLFVAQTLTEDKEEVDASTLLTKLFFGAFGSAYFAPVLDQAHHLLTQMSATQHPKEYAELATKLAKGAFRFRGKHKATDWSEKALQAAPDRTIIWLAAAAQHVLSLVDEGYRDDAAALFETVEDVAGTFPDDLTIAPALLDVATSAHEMGNFDALRTFCRRVLHIGRAAGNVDAQARAWIHLSYASYDLGEFERAAEEAGNLELLMDHRHPHEKLVVGGAVPPLLKLQMGKADECYQSLKEREAIALETRHYGLEFYILLGLAQWAAKYNAPATHEYLTRALTNASVNDSPKSVAHARFLLALEEIALDQHEAALTRLRTLRKDPRSPANPEQWNDALDAFIWLCEMRLDAKPGPAHENSFGRLVLATYQTINSDPNALKNLLRTTSSALYTVPGLYLTRLDFIAQNIAERLSHAGHVLRIDREGRKFQIDLGEIHDMSRKGVARKILLELAQAHHQNPRRALSVTDVIDVGWPHEKISHEAALTRVYTTMNRLRALDLTDILITQDDGYALESSVQIEWVDGL